MAILKAYIEGVDAEIMPSIPAPRILYKFRSVNDWSLDILRKRTIWFSPPDNFNDPFDCDVPVRFDLLNDTEFDELSITVIDDLRKIGRDKAAKHYYNNVKVKEDFGTPQYRKGMVTAQLKRLKERVTVFCLAEGRDNILLWSHYGDNHSGFCIGFDKNYLYYNTGADFGIVRYLDEYPVFKPTYKNEDWFVGQVLSKAHNWTYEMEYRFVNFNGKTSFEIESKSIAEIIFGCKTSDQDIEQVISIVSKDPLLKHVRLFKAFKVPGSFKLSVMPL